MKKCLLLFFSLITFMVAHVTAGNVTTNEETTYAISWETPAHCQSVKVTDLTAKTAVQSGDRVSDTHEIRIEVAPETGYIVKHAYENGNEIYPDDINPDGVALYSLVLEADAKFTFSIEQVVYCKVDYQMELPNGVMNVYNKYDNFNRIATGSTFLKDTPIALVVTPDKGSTVTAIKANGKDLAFTVENGEAVVGNYDITEDVQLTAEISDPAQPLHQYQLRFNQPAHARCNVIYGAGLTPIQNGATVKEGRLVRFLVGPNKGYYVKSITKNGQKVLPISYGGFKEYDYTVAGNDSIGMEVVRGEEPQYKVIYTPDLENGIVQLYKRNASKFVQAIGRKNAKDYAGTVIRLDFIPDPTARILSIKLNGVPYAFDPQAADKKVSIETQIPFEDLNVDVEFSPQSTPSPIVPIHYRVEPANTATAAVFSLNSRLIIENGDMFKVGRKLGLLIAPERKIKIKVVLFNGKVKKVWKASEDTGFIPFTLEGETDIVIKMDEPTGIASPTTATPATLLIDKEQLTLSSEQATPFCIYNLAGQVIQKGSVKGKTTLHLPTQQFYIVKVGTQSTKIFMP